MSYIFDEKDPMFGKKVKYMGRVGTVKGYAKGADGRRCYVVHVDKGPWHTHLFPMNEATRMPDEDGLDQIWSDCAVLTYRVSHDLVGKQELVEEIKKLLVRMERACTKENGL